MDYIWILKIISIFEIILALYLAYLSYDIFKRNKLSMGWLAMTIAFVLIIFRRIVTFIGDFKIFNEIQNLILPLEELLILILTLFFIVALVTLKNDLQNQGLLDQRISSEHKKGKR